MKELIPQERIEQRIFVIRRQKLMIDRDLAELYGVKTKYLNQQVRRNIKRFPQEFMFSLRKEERNELVAICNRFQTLKHSEEKIEGHDADIKDIFEAIRQLMGVPDEHRKITGFA